jgi:hypothetical protein
MYFCRNPINIDVSEICLDVGQLKMNAQYVKPQKYGLALQKQSPFVSVPTDSFEAKEQDAHKIISQLPQKLLAIEIPKVWVLSVQATHDEKVMLAPHRDGVRLTAINFYKTTHNERTVFYKYKAGVIEEADSFIAQDGDSYIMNVDEPHSVELCPGEVRKFLTLAFISTPFAQVVNALN